MRLDKSAFQSMAAMFANHRPGLDEIEATVMDAASDINRDTVMRVIQHYVSAATAKKPTVEDVLDVQIDTAGGVAGAVTRVSVHSIEAIKSVLKSVSFVDRTDVTAMRKSRVRPSVNLHDYRMRVNMKEEIPIQAPQLQHLLRAIPTTMGKTFRLKRRYSFALGKEFRLDITAVRQKTTGAAVPQFQDMMRCQETYEMEIEYVGAEKSDKGAIPTAAAAASCTKQLLQHFNVLLKVIDDTSILLSRSEKAAILEQYVRTVWGPSVSAQISTDPRVRARLFVGPKPVTLQAAHLRAPSEEEIEEAGTLVRVRDGDYTITDKADGEHRLLFIDAQGAAYTLDDRLVVRATGLRGPAALAGTLLDGEHVPTVNSFMAFDAYYIAGEDVRSLPLMLPTTARLARNSSASRRSALASALASTASSRLEAARRVTSALKSASGSSASGSGSAASGSGSSASGSKGEYTARVKEFAYIHAGDDVFKQCRALLLRRDAKKYPYDIDGFIFTPASVAVMGAAPGAPAPPWSMSGKRSWDRVLKWKPAHFNSVDMLVRLRSEKSSRGGVGGAGDASLVVTADGCEYRVADLYVGQQAGPMNRSITPLEWATGAAETRMAGAWGGNENRTTYEEVPFDAPGRPPCVCADAAEPLHVAQLLRNAKDGKLYCDNGDEIQGESIVEFAFDVSGPPCLTSSASTAVEADAAETGAEGGAGGGAGRGRKGAAVALAAARQPQAASGSSTYVPLARRWKPMRLRHDKMEAYQRTGVITANNIKAAQDVWDSIIRPVTEAMLSGKEPIPDAHNDTDAGYYVRNRTDDNNQRGDGAPTDARPMRRFHNWVKKDVLLMPFGGGRTRSLFDVGVGRGGDIDKWLAMGGVKRILGIDKFGSNLTDPMHKGGGAFIRALRAKQRLLQQGQQQHGHNQQQFPKLMFLEMDATMPFSRATLENLDDTNGDRTVARVMWGAVEPTDIPDAKLRTYHGFALGGYDLATCMFAIHYFFETRDKLVTLARNVAGMIRQGGTFVGCTLDGARVEALLQKYKTPDGGWVAGGCPDNDPRSRSRCAWRITRRFPDTAAAAATAKAKAGSGGPGDESFGRRIDVYVDSIGQTFPEYVVDFEVLVAVMAEAGLHLVPDEECRELGVLGGKATGTFDQAFEALLPSAPIPAPHTLGPGPQSTAASAASAAAAEAAAMGGGGGGKYPKGVAQTLGVASMTEDEKTFSFLNRWFMFRKQ